MTRKRFVKLLMSHGYDRNSANLMAREVYLSGDSYAAVYRRNKWLYEGLASINIDALALAIERFKEAMTRTTIALSAGFAAFNEAFRFAMETGKDHP